jgi:adenosine deaminase
LLAEIKWGPALHVERGLTLDEVIDAVCTGADVGVRATGTAVRLTVVAVRSDAPALNREVPLAGARFKHRGVTGDRRRRGDRLRRPHPKGSEMSS